MTDITETETFACSLTALSDASIRYRIQAQLNRLQFGVPQYCQAVVDNIFALHVADHQVYYITPGENQILLLCIGQSACTDADVACAVKLAEEVAP